MKHIIFFDDALEYYDGHERTPICVTDTPEGAEKEKTRLSDWLQRTQERFPVINGRGMDQDAFIAAEDERREKICRLRCPYGSDALRGAVQHGRGYFVITAVPTVESH